MNRHLFIILCDKGYGLVDPPQSAEIWIVAVEDDPVITMFRHRKRVGGDGVAYMKIEDEDQPFPFIADGLVRRIHVELSRE